MDTRPLIQRFRYILSLSSFAYVFNTLHTIQYEMQQDHDEDDTPTQAYDYPQSPQPVSTSTSESIKTTGRWTDDEIRLLLDYVESNFTFTSAGGSSLGRDSFKNAHALKTKDSNQCQYKWRQVCILIINIGFHHLSALQLCGTYKAISQWDKKSGCGWHDMLGANVQTPSEHEVFQEFLKTPDVSTRK